MARLHARRRRTRQNQIERSVNFLNNVSTNLHDDNNNNSHAEDSESSDDALFVPQDSDVDENDSDPEAGAPVQHTFPAIPSKFVGVVVQNREFAEASKTSKSYQDEEAPESEQDSVSSEESDNEGAAEENFERTNIGQTASRRRRQSAEREESTEGDGVANETDQWVPATRRRTWAVDRMEGNSARTNELSSRKRRRTTDAIENVPQSRRRRRQSPIRSSSLAPSSAGESDAFEEWEASMVVETPPAEEEEVVIYDGTICDDATKIMELERSWRDLMSGCQKIKSTETDEAKSYKGIKDICNHIRALIDIYKQIQRDRSMGLITPRTWKLAEQCLKPITHDADIIQLKITRRAHEAKHGNDFRIRADANEYAEEIYKHVVTNLSELALECLKAYYSEDNEWLLSGGFTAVLNILDITGKLNNTLSSLKKRDLVSTTRDVFRLIRIPLRIIYDRLSRCETEDRQRG